MLSMGGPSGNNELHFITIKKKWVREGEGRQMENKVQYEDVMATEDKTRVCVGTEV